MSLAEVCAKQHDREQAALRNMLFLALLGSLGLHGGSFAMAQLGIWQPVVDPELTPLEVIVTEPPIDEIDSPQKPEEGTPEPRIPDPFKRDTFKPIQPSAPAEAKAAAPKAEVVAAPTPGAGEPQDTVAETQVESEAEVAAGVGSEEDLDNADQFNRLREYFQQLVGERGAEGNGSETDNGTGNGSGESSGTGDGTGTAEPAVAATDSPRQGRGSRTVACQDCVSPRIPLRELTGREVEPRVNIEINPDGTVRSVTLTRSSGNEALDRAALEAARRTKFEPVAGGASVPLQYDLPQEDSRGNRRRQERRAIEVDAPESEPNTASGTGNSDVAPGDPAITQPEAQQPEAGNAEATPVPTQTTEVSPTASPASNQGESPASPTPPRPAPSTAPAPTQPTPVAAPAAPAPPRPDPPAAPEPAPVAPTPAAEGSDSGE